MSSFACQGEVRDIVERARQPGGVAQHRHVTAVELEHRRVRKVRGHVSLSARRHGSVVAEHDEDIGCRVERTVLHDGQGDPRWLRTPPLEYERGVLGAEIAAELAAGQPAWEEQHWPLRSYGRAETSYE